jgi:phage-related protein
MRSHLHIKHSLILLSLASLFWLGASANAQITTQPPDNGQVSTLPPGDRDSDITNGELANMDRFLDRHPEIAEQLQKDPSLVNNREFVENHPALREFLEQHPKVREEVRENPNAFMGQEDRYDRREDRGRDTTRGELASMDRFLDHHPEIAEQLHKNPSLVNNHEFVENHPALQEYLQNHPEVREEIKENPNAFMRQEDRYDRHEDSRDRGEATTGFGDRDRRGASTPLGENDRDRETTASFGQFLQGHTTVAADLSKNPSLANNKEYMANHPELQDYLKNHPEAQRQLSTNPQAFMKSAQVTAPPTKAPNPATNPKENH